MDVMLIVLAVWTAVSLLIGLTVGRAIQQADSAEFPARPSEWWVRPTTAAPPPDAARADDPDQVADAA